jgi:hypothetical protein
MGLRFFVVPVDDSSAFEQELNGFLARHKVVSIDRHLIGQGVNSFRAIRVDYLSHTPGEKVPNAAGIRCWPNRVRRRSPPDHELNRPRAPRRHVSPSNLHLS